MTRLADKVALVIGGASGIGQAIAKRFAAEGAYTYITGRRQSDLEEALEQIGAGATPSAPMQVNSQNSEALWRPCAHRPIGSTCWSSMLVCPSPAGSRKSAKIFSIATSDSTFDHSYSLCK